MYYIDKHTFYNLTVIGFVLLLFGGATNTTKKASYLPQIQTAHYLGLLFNMWIPRVYNLMTQKTCGNCRSIRE